MHCALSVGTWAVERGVWRDEGEHGQEPLCVWLKGRLHPVRGSVGHAKQFWEAGRWGSVPNLSSFARFYGNVADFLMLGFLNPFFVLRILSYIEPRIRIRIHILGWISIRIRVQSGSRVLMMTKNRKKIYSWKFFLYCFWIKLQFTFP